MEIKGVYGGKRLDYMLEDQALSAPAQRSCRNDIIARMTHFSKSANTRQEVLASVSATSIADRKQVSERFRVSKE